MKLNQLKSEFEAIGVNVAGMTYDDPEFITDFSQSSEIAFPLLRDVERAHVEAWGIRNEEYGEGTFAYGIPHPGVVLISPTGEILAKFANPGYRSRPDWDAVLEGVQSALGGD